jgi:DNA-binding NarL/FixJ family response regulator
MIADNSRVSSPLTVSLLFPLVRCVNAKHFVNSWSTREFRIVRLLVNGLKQKHLTAKLKISPETVRSQSQTIFYKLRSSKLLQGSLPALQK